MSIYQRCFSGRGGHAHHGHLIKTTTEGMPGGSGCLRQGAEWPFNPLAVVAGGAVICVRLLAIHTAALGISDKLIRAEI